MVRLFFALLLLSYNNDIIFLKANTQDFLIMKSKPNKNKTDIFSCNLQFLISERKITLNQLADDIGLPIMTIRRIVYGETTDPRLSTITAFADYFDVDLNILLTTKFQRIKDVEGVKPVLVPVYNFEELESLFNQQKNKDTPLSWIPVFQTKKIPLSSNTFAIQAQKYMHGRFPEGTILVFDDVSHLVDGDIVLVKDKTVNKLLVREYEKNPPIDFLVNIFEEPHNKSVFNDKKQKIIAVNVKAIVTNKN